MFAQRYFAERYFASTYWARHKIFPFTSFAGRGPGADGNITPLSSDYSAFYLSEDVGDDRYLREVPSEYLTVTAADALYLQAIPSEYMTQTEADAQGMPMLESVEYSGGGTPSGPISHGTGNITLREAGTGLDYWQSRENTGASAITVRAPSGYTINGSASIDPGQSGVFVKEAGSPRFRRLG